MSNELDRRAVAESIVRAQLIIKEQEEIIAQGKSLLRDIEPGYLEFEAEGRPTLALRVTTNSRIDDGLARRNLDPAVYEAVSKQTVDTAKARALLTDLELSKITKNFANRVEVWIP